MAHLIKKAYETVTCVKEELERVYNLEADLLSLINDFEEPFDEEDGDLPGGRGLVQKAFNNTGSAIEGLTCAHNALCELIGGLYVLEKDNEDES